jgi:hypothetical protein
LIKNLHFEAKYFCVLMSKHLFNTRMSSETKKNVDLKTVAIGAVAVGAVVVAGAALLRLLKKDQTGRRTTNPAAAEAALASNVSLHEAVTALKNQFSVSPVKLDEIKNVRSHPFFQCELPFLNVSNTIGVFG